MRKKRYSLLLALGILAGTLANPLTVSAQSVDWDNDDESTWLIVPETETGISGTVTLRVGQTKDLYGHVTTYEKYDGDKVEWYFLKNTMKWSSSNTEVATVDASGKVTGLRNGVSTVRMTGYDNMSRTHVQTITVRVSAPSTGSSGTSAKKTSSLTIAQGVRIDLSVLVDRDAYETVEWSSARPDLVSVSSSGVVEGIEVGSVTISAVCTDVAGNTTTQKFTVRVLTSYLNDRLRECTLYLKKGETVDLLALLYPSYNKLSGARGYFTLSSSKPATVSFVDHVITAKAMGASNVTVTETHGVTDTTLYKITVSVS